MFTRYFTRQHAFLALPVLVLLFLSGCGVTDTATSPSMSQSSLITTPAKSSTTAVATLKHMPTGSAALNWNHSDHLLTIQVTLAGLAPNSVHPAHIHEGDCSRNGKVLYRLTSVVADAHGVGSATTKINMPKGIPASGWYINIHNGPDLSTSDQSMTIVCNNIINHDTSLRSNQSVQVPLNTAPSTRGQNVSGTAHLSISGHTLSVHMSMSGLIPGSEHMAHIHAGTCASQGAVIYALPIVKADSSGKATVTATIQNILAIPTSGWYINVHRSTDLSTQTGFDPIACGDVVPA